MNDIKVGLVLSGGGAKGAYQVGVVKALDEIGTQVDAVAGASIGALNGAILAAAPSLKDGATRLEELWLDLAETSPLEISVPAYISFLAAVGLRLNGLSTLTSLTNQLYALAGGGLPSWIDERLILMNRLNSGVLSDTPLQRHLDRYLDQTALNKGLPLYVSAFRSQGALSDLLRYLVAEHAFIDSPESEFLHIQSLPLNEQKDALLGSAAIPLLFAPKKVNDSTYSDGGLGGWQKMQGNTPITPLLNAGYKMIIVTHLSDGSLWSRQDFPDATILEIRPQSNITRDGSIIDLLGFDAKKIPSWIEQGYQDTLHCMERVKKVMQARFTLKESEMTVNNSLKANDNLDAELVQAMHRLNSIS